MDIRLAPAVDHVDIALVSGDLERDEGLSTSVLVSLFSDARAPLDPAVPILEQQPRGWWGEDEGDRFGSLLWTLARSKQTQETLSRAREYAISALKWMIEDQVAAAVDVQAEWVSRGVLGLRITISRGTSRRWAQLWRGMREDFPGSIDLGSVVLQLALA
jgi:phage gp46-like protein